MDFMDMDAKPSSSSTKQLNATFTHSVALETGLKTSTT